MFGRVYKPYFQTNLSNTPPLKRKLSNLITLKTLKQMKTLTSNGSVNVFPCDFFQTFSHNILTDSKNLCILKKNQTVMKHFFYFLILGLMILTVVIIILNHY